jgi:hypothetical protein
MINSIHFVVVNEKFVLQLVHAYYELQAKQFKGQTMQEPLDRYNPGSQVEHDWVVD